MSRYRYRPIKTRITYSAISGCRQTRSSRRRGQRWVSTLSLLQEDPGSH